MFIRRVLLVIAILILTACSAQIGSRAQEPATPSAADATAVAGAVATIRAATVGAAPTPSLTPPPEPTLAPLPTDTLEPTSDPYAGLTITSLLERSYEGGILVVEEEIGNAGPFTRYLVSYPSDGLTIHGFLNLPHGDGPFPVVVALHGYIEPSRYYTLDYTTPYADALASAGFLVVHPNLRGYAPSDDGPNRFLVGFAVDVMNLIAAIQQQAGTPGVLEKADPARLGLWGHSMGGGVTLRTLVLSPDVDAAVLYGAMSGDEQLNYERIFNVFSDRQRGLEELNTPADDLARISPVYFYDRIQAAVSVHHGEQDTEVPPEWSQDLCKHLTDLGKNVECFLYPNQPHTFFGEGDSLFIQRTIEFYNRIFASPNGFD